MIVTCRLESEAKQYFTAFFPVTANKSLAPELRSEVDFINFMDLEMSRGDKAITLLSGGGGGVIKPIAKRWWGGDKKKALWGGCQGGNCRARLPEGWLDWHLIATFFIFSVGGFSYKAFHPHFPPQFFFLCGQGQIGGCSIVHHIQVSCGGLEGIQAPPAAWILGRLGSRVGGLQCNDTRYHRRFVRKWQSFISWT